MDEVAAWSARPAATLRHPVVLGALVLWAVNDHVLKGRAGGWATGKLSDVACLVVVPALLVSVVALATGRADHRVALVATVAVAAAFAAIQVSDPAADLYRAAFGVARWPVDAVVAILTGDALPAVGRRALLWPDVTDLLVLPVAAVPVVLADRRAPGAAAPGRPAAAPPPARLRAVPPGVPPLHPVRGRR